MQADKLRELRAELIEHAADLDRCAVVFETSELAQAFAATALELRVAANENRERADKLLAIAEASEGLRADAMRYRWMREWFVRGGKLSEIAPAGHILRTTNAIVDASVDAALSGAVQGESSV